MNFYLMRSINYEIRFFYKIQGNLSIVVELSTTLSSWCHFWSWKKEKVMPICERSEQNWKKDKKWPNISKKEREKKKKEEKRRKIDRYMTHNRIIITKFSYNRFQVHQKQASCSPLPTTHHAKNGRRPFFARLWCRL